MTLVNFNNATFNGRDNRIIACGTDPNDSWIDTFGVDSVSDDPRGIIQFGGNTWGYDFSYLAIGQTLGFRIIHNGTTLYFYTKIHNTTDPLPTDLSQWRYWYSRAWDLNTYPLSKKSTANPNLAELTGLFQLGGSNFADGTTDTCQSGIYDLANTRLVINGEVVYGGEYLANPAQATSDKYGLVKIDNNTIKTTQTGKIYVDSSVVVPANMVTTDTEQTITGAKTFEGAIRTDNIYNTNASRYLSCNKGTGEVTIGSGTNNNVRLSGRPIIDLSTSYVLDIKGKVYKAGATTETLSVIEYDSRNKVLKIGNTDSLVRNGNNEPFLTTGNFATAAPTGALKYWTGTEAAYTELDTKDADTLYRTTDTNKVYLGTIQLGGA